jgi:hypothetical protein
MQCRFFLWFDKETCPHGKELLPPLRDELKCLKENVIQLRAWKRQLTQMLVYLSVVFIALVGVLLMGCKVMLISVKCYTFKPFNLYMLSS